jgi:DNA polymerase I
MRTYVGDLEADGLLDTVTQIWCGVFKSLDGKDIVKFRPHQMKEMFEFLDTVDTLIMHNGHGYDWPLMEKLHGYVYKGNKIDTVVWSRLFSPKRPIPFHCPIKNKPHSVETWGYRVGRGKPEHNDWTQFSEAMLHRCSEDVEIQLLIYKELYKESQQYNWNNATWLTGRLFEILGKQEQYGWLVDRPWMDKCIRQCTHWIDRIDNALAPRLPIVRVIDEKKVKGVMSYVKKPFKKDGTLNANVVRWLDNDTAVPISNCFSRVSFRPLDPNSRVEAIAYLLDMGWVPKEWNFNKETKERTSPKLSKDDPFEGITDRVGKLFAKRMQIKHRRSNVEGLIKHIREDGRIPSVVTNLAETGRATHSKIVNIPNGDAFFGKWMRKIFIAEEGKVLIGTDSAGCQLRMLAGRMGDKEYTEVIVNGDKDKGTDMHTVNQKAAGLATRGQAKTFIYGFLFGAGDEKIGKIVHGGANDGKRLKAEFLKGLPALGALIERLKEEWRSTAKSKPNKWGGTTYYDGYIIGLDGRPIFIDSEHKILVYLLQSDEAIMMAAAYVFLYDWLEAEGLVWGRDWAYVAWYHDEYTIEALPEHTKRIQYLAEQAIVAAGEYYKISCPHEGESQVGEDWYDIH